MRGWRKTKRVRRGRERQVIRAFELREAGRATKAIARELQAPRSTFRGWFGAFAGVAQLAEAIDLKSIQWGFDSLHQHQRQAMYTSWACISVMDTS